MTILNFCTTHWTCADDASEKGDGRFGLLNWLRVTNLYFKPSYSFMACGTWSDPRFSPLLELPSVPVINSGVQLTAPYDPFYWSYQGCALTAAMAYALNQLPWDLLVWLDTDCVVGAVDFDALLREFLSRPELMLSGNWHGRPGGPLHVFKPDGAARWLHQRRRANLIDPSEPEPMLLEDEKALIFKDSWWNPWKQETLRQDYGSDSEKYVNPRDTLTWPFIRRPHPNILEEYARTQTSQAKPVMP